MVQCVYHNSTAENNVTRFCRGRRS